MSVSAQDVRFDADAMWVTLSDGRVLGVPIVWFPRLLHATPEAREGWTLSPFGIHWEALDEDISGYPARQLRNVCINHDLQKADHQILYPEVEREEWT